LFTLTESQIVAGQPQWQQERDARIAAYLCREYPTMARSPDSLMDGVAAARHYANDLGFTADRHVADIVEACFLFGPSLNTHATFQHILQRSLWTAEDKCIAICNHVIAPRRKETL
jgi:hypothetical protein